MKNCARSVMACILMGSVLPLCASAADFSAWGYRASIRLAGYTRAENLTNFPVLVVLGTNTISGFRYADFQSGQNADLRFAASNGTDELNYEIESWNTNGNSHVWVQVPVLADTNATIHAYWGNAAVTQPAYTTNGATWTNAFRGVWHLQSTNVPDSTTNQLHATPVGNVDTAGRIGNGQDFALGTYAYVSDTPNNPRLDVPRLTIAFWMKGPAAQVDAYCRMVDRKWDGAFCIARNGSGTTAGLWCKATGPADSTVAVLDGTWHHVVYTFNGFTSAAFVDGVPRGPSDPADGDIPAQTDIRLTFAANYSGGERYVGALDEIRLSEVPRSANWIWAEWMNVASNTPFAAYGPALAQSTAPQLENRPATDVSASDATLHGFLVSTGASDSGVSVYWGDNDGGADLAAWDHTNDFPATQSPGPLSTSISGLATNTLYFYRFHGTNAGGGRWAEPSAAFLTGELAINATDATASETGLEPGAFTVYRPEWATNLPLVVNYTLSGTASNGLDYELLGNSVTIPAGATNATIPVTPRQDLLVEGAESVLVTLAPGPYLAGPASGATVTLNDAANATWYVSATGHDTNSGVSWASAFASVTNGLAHAAPADTVLVSNGTYDVVSTNYGSGVTIDSSITLRSVNGPAFTTLRRNGGGSFRVLHMKPGAAGALVAGFTLRGGYTQLLMGGGAGALVQAGTVSNCWLISNTSAQPLTRNYRFTAAGVHIDGGTVVDCVIANNTAQDYLGGRGGGVYIAGGLVLRCTITNNSARGVSSDSGGQPCALGGGVYFEGAGGTVESCFIARNSAEYAGGVYLVGGGTLRNCIVADNPYGGGVYMTAGTVESCTIAGNQPAWYQAESGLYQSGGTVLNCIIAANAEGYSPRISADYNPVNKTGGSLTYCVLQDPETGTGNIVTNPLLLDPAKWDFRLAATSPAINAGSDQGWMTGATDLDGDPRLTGTVDPGAQEEDSAAGPFRVYWDAAQTLGTNALAASFSATVAGADTAGVVYYWSFGDGTASNDTAATMAHTYGPGVYSVTLTASNGSGAAAAVTRSGYVKVLTDEPVYVRVGAGNTQPYTNWATAATDIRAAVNLANGRVIVSNGAHNVTATLLIERPITVESVNGPTVTAIRASATSGGDPYRVVDLRPAAAGAVLTGFAISNGFTMVYRGGGAGVQMAAGTVTNCLIVRNTAMQPVNRNNRMHGAGAIINGGLMVDCLIANNAGTDWLGARGAVYMTNGLLLRCTVTNNNVFSTADASTSMGGGVYFEGGGMAQHCTLAANGAWYGGGAYLAGGGVLRNCLVKDAPNGGGVYVTGGSVENCTVVNNARGAATGITYNGMKMTGGTSVDSIVYWNQGALNAVEVSGGAQFSYGHCESTIAGASNSTVDPNFVNRLTGDWHLAGGSTCIDTGTNLAWVAAGVDLDGAARLVNGAVDRGAFENSPNVGPLVCNFAPLPEPPVGSESLPVIFSSTVNGSNISDLVYYWDLGDGQTPWGADKAVVTNTYGFGTYTVRLDVTNAAGEGASKLKAEHVIVRTTNTLYVATTGSHTTPFTNWATAATNLQTAVRQAEALVLVGDGLHTVNEDVTVSRPLTIRSRNGKNATHIRFVGTFGRVFNMTTNATLDGFTVSGANSSGSGGGVYMDGGLVQNCVILRNNAAGLDNNGCGGVQMFGASKLRNCLITANTGVDRAAGIRVHSAGCEVDNCTVVGNWTGYHHAGILVTAPAVIRNTIAVSNLSGTTYHENWNLQGGATAVYSSGPDIPAGTGNVITNGPGFWSFGTGTLGLTFVPGDYRLKDGSPCINTGTNLTWMAGAKSLLGNARITGGRVEMGAYEQPSAGSVFLVR